MTELQVVINSLMEAMIAADLVLLKLKKAKKDLETPPTHKWEHGDVFLNEFGTTMIYIRGLAGQTPTVVHVFCISGLCDCAHNPRDFLAKGKFLFNIKEKL